MDKTVIIIDDDVLQADALKKLLAQELSQYNFESYSAENEIWKAVEDRFYSLAIVDIRMDKYPYDGIQVTKKIFEVNPFAKVILISAFKDEYFNEVKDLVVTGKVIDVLSKEKLKIWIPELKIIIEDYFNLIDNDPSEINKALLDYYAAAKNNSDTYDKGLKFERFISLLFQSFGYKEIIKRVKDKSLNEVDLIVRNETDDVFLNKFGKYILIECKNKPEDPVTKNDFITFYSKLKHTASLSEFGIIATTGYIARNTYFEALRETGNDKKVIFISNPEIEKLINAPDKKEEFKRLIDLQVKDN